MTTIAAQCKNSVEALRVRDLLIIQGFHLCRVTSDADSVATSVAEEIPFFNGFTSHGDEHACYAQDAQVHELREEGTTVLIDVPEAGADELSVLLLRYGATNVRESAKR